MRNRRGHVHLFCPHVLGIIVALVAMIVLYPIRRGR